MLICAATLNEAYGAVEQAWAAPTERAGEILLEADCDANLQAEAIGRLRPPSGRSFEQAIEYCRENDDWRRRLAGYDFTPLESRISNAKYRSRRVSSSVASFVAGPAPRRRPARLEISSPMHDKPLNGRKAADGSGSRAGEMAEEAKEAAGASAFRRWRTAWRMMWW